MSKFELSSEFNAFLGELISTPKLSRAIILVAFGTYVLAFLSPMFSSSLNLSSSMSQELTDQLQSISFSAFDDVTLPHPLYVNPLLYASVTVHPQGDHHLLAPSASTPANAPSLSSFEPLPNFNVIRLTYAVNFTNLIISAGVAMVALLSAGLAASGSGITASVSGVGIGLVDAEKIEKPVAVAETPNAETLLLRESESARRHASMLFQRATYMLISGVIMAFIGIGVFATLYQVFPVPYVSFKKADAPSMANELLRSPWPTSSTDGTGGTQTTVLSDMSRLLPATATDSDKRNALNVLSIMASGKPDSIDSTEVLSMLRPFGILVFIETIAWFLLRQYRSLLEDYKIFYRVYLERANRLIAYEIITKDSDQARVKEFVERLLETNKNVVLKKGETTEYIESLRQVDQFPLIGILEKMVDKLPGA